MLGQKLGRFNLTLGLGGVSKETICFVFYFEMEKTNRLNRYGKWMDESVNLTKHYFLIILFFFSWKALAFQYNSV